MKKKKSFIREILIYLLILMCLLIGILGIFLVSSYGILESEIKNSSEAFLTIYSNEFENSMADINGLLKSVTTQGLDLAKIKSENENDRLIGAVSLHDYMMDLISGNDVTDAVVLYDSNYEICLDAISSSIDFNQKNAIRDYTIEMFEDKELENGTWNFAQIDGAGYLFKVLKTDDRIISIYTKMNHLLGTLETEENDNRFILLMNAEGQIGKVWGNETNDIIEGNYTSSINADNYYITKKVVNQQFTIGCYTSKMVIFEQTHSSMLIVIIIVLVTVVFMLFILHYTKKKILSPMKVMVKDMSIIEDGEFENRINGEFDTSEFQMLQNTTNHMIDEIVGLKIQRYEKHIELQDMELKSIRLQLKPHFFLNALTTISSLSSQNKNVQIKVYIEALSRNVRYMFRTGFHTVTVKEEIKHVENYFEMQELKYPNLVFYLIDLPVGLEEWKIPQMLIHTFVENEYKYAVSVDSTLTILIKVRKVINQEIEMLLIEIEDDGVGYPEEVLHYMNGMVEKSDKENRVGLWSIKRMMELMYERTDLVVLDNIVPHGCINKIYIPVSAMHEL